MNKYFYTLAILLLSVSVYAQTFTEQQDSLFQHLDKNKIPSGVLYNRVFPWAGLDMGKDNDFNITYDYAKQAWLELELATYNPEGLLSLEELEQRVQQNNFENKGISIGYIDYYFNSIDSNAFINGDLIIGEDSLFYDGPGNPYLEHRVVMPVISAQSISGDSVTFYLDPEIKLSNTGSHLDQFIINIPANGTHVIIHPGQSQTIYIGDIETNIVNAIFEPAITPGPAYLPDYYDTEWIIEIPRKRINNSFGSDKCVEYEKISSGSNLVFQG